MTDPVIRSRIDPALKAEANRILRSMGLTMSEAIRLFLHQVVAEKGLPFPVKAPNAETIAAMEAADRGKHTPTSLEQIARDWDEACAK